MLSSSRIPRILCDDLDYLAAALQHVNSRAGQSGSEPGNQPHRPGGEPGDRRIGVVWHTQGSGKSLTMVFYAGRIIREPAMSNPTVVLLTDRNDLGDQLFSTFSRCEYLLHQPPVQAESRHIFDSFSTRLLMVWCSPQSRSSCPTIEEIGIRCCRRGAMSS